MSAPREELQEALCQYTADTLICISTVRGFCEKSTKWILMRETELEMMMDIKDRADKINLSVSHVTKSGNRGQAFLEYMKNKVTLVTADSRVEELEKELGAVLKDTLGGLEKLDCFRDAVERLAVTSPRVFMVEGQALRLPQGVSPDSVWVAIAAARLACPLLLEFKRDASVFFLPRLQNVEVFAYQLDKYIQTTQKICEKLEKSCFCEFSLKMPMDTVVDLDVNWSEWDIRRMLCHINQLQELRLDQNFRMSFMFEDKQCRHFISEFSKRQPAMLQFLKELEESAVQLDRMNKGSKISSVAGSSVGAVGGVLAIVGLALSPVTAGASLALTMAGLGLGITSGVNSAVTTATEVGVNRTYQKKASEAFRSFMDDVQVLQGCLEGVTDREASQIDMAVGVSKVLCKVGLLGKGIDSLVDAATVPVLKSEAAITSAGKVVAQEAKAFRNVPRVAADIPDIGQAVAKGPLALTKSARAGFIALNALFVGMDIFFICKDSVSLAKGSETEFSQFIRARATLWSSEMDAWQKIHDSLREGLPTSEDKRVILETPFEPETEISEVETKKEAPSDEVNG